MYRIFWSTPNPWYLNYRYSIRTDRKVRARTDFYRKSNFERYNTPISKFRSTPLPISAFPPVHYHNCHHLEKLYAMVVRSSSISASSTRVGSSRPCCLMAPWHGTSFPGKTCLPSRDRIVTSNLSIGYALLRRLDTGQYRGWRLHALTWREKFEKSDNTKIFPG